MRHLIDTYIEADEPRKISPFDDMALLELIVKTGIADAIDSQLGGLKGNKDAVAETIENNVRSKIIKEHLNDPAYYEKMSALLDEIIADRKAKRDRVRGVPEAHRRAGEAGGSGQADDTPEQLNTPGKRALYNNLKQSRRTSAACDDEAPVYAVDDASAGLALTIDEAVKRVRPDGWRGVQARENRSSRRALYAAAWQDVAEVERIFLIIKAQTEY